jgi:sugar phosphate isomerase/epimerase
VPGDGSSVSAQKQLAPILADLGYAGMACVGSRDALELREALEKHGQKLVVVYIDVNLDPGNRGYDPAVKDLLPKLEGRGTVLWVVVGSSKYKPSSTEGDARAVELLQLLADAASKHGIQLSLYPHVGCYGLPGDRRDILARSAKGWQAITAKAGKSP